MAISTEAFTTLIEERAAHPTEAALTDRTILELEGTHSQVLVRNQGGLILEAVLENDSGVPVPVLYADADDTLNKINASHIMSPAGHYDGLGGQHGYARWADYRVTQEGDVLFMMAEAPDDSAHITQEIRLDEEDPAELTLITELTNDTQAELETSLGNHLYFNLPNGDAGGLKIGVEQDQMHAMPNEAAIMDGKAQAWNAYDGEMYASFPDGKRLSILSEVVIMDEQGEEIPHDIPISMWLWHRPGTESICLEPVAGCESLTDNRKITLGIGQTVSMKTTIILL